MAADIEIKWGAPVLGEASGPIYWASELLSDLDYDDARYDADDFDASLQAAFDAWEGVAAVDFERASEGDAAGITISLSPLSGATVGYASLVFDDAGGIAEITSAEIVLDSLENWAPSDDGTSATDFYAVALHEIGHAIGLDHVDDPSEIMNPVIGAANLGDGDIASIQALYGADPEDSSSPPDVPDLPEPGPSGKIGFAPVASDGSSSPGFFEAVFGWFFDLIGSLFGTGGGEDVAEVPDEPDFFVPDEPVPMTGDVVMREYIPLVADEDDPEIVDDDPDDFGGIFQLV